MNQNGPHSIAEQKCFEFVLSHKYDKIKLIKWTHNQSWTKLGENGCAHKSEIPLEWLDDGKQRTT